MTFSLLLDHHVHAFEQCEELGRLQAALDPVTCSKPAELTGFQVFAPQAIAAGFEGQDLDVCAAAIDEGEPVARYRIFPKSGPDFSRQTIEALAHIRCRRTQPDASSGLDPQHDPRRSRRTMPSPRSSSISHGVRAALEVAGSSMKDMG